MTIRSYQSIMDFKRDQSRNNRQNVLDAIRQLTKPNEMRIYSKEPVKNKFVSSQDVSKYLETQTHNSNKEKIQHIEMMYENGEITKHEMNSLKKKIIMKSLNLRSIQRWISVLKTEGLLENEDNKYTLSQKAKTEIRHFATGFGERALRDMMTMHNYTHNYMYNTLDKNLKHLVTLFGVYIIFCFIEAAKPVEDDFVNERRNSPVSTKQKDKLVKLWVKEVIDPFMMYIHFLETFKNQPPNDLVDGLRTIKLKVVKADGRYIYVDKNGKEYDKFPFIASSDFTLCIDKNDEVYVPPLRKQIPVDTEYYTYSNNGDSKQNPYYELDNEIITTLTETLKRKYPKIYQNLRTARSDFYKGEKDVFLRGFLKEQDPF